MKPKGTCYLTVPYNYTYRETSDWRMYDHKSIYQRLIREFSVEEKIFFISGYCNCPHTNGIVSEKDANNYRGDLPHVACFLKLRKSILGDNFSSHASGMWLPEELDKFRRKLT